MDSANSTILESKHKLRNSYGAGEVQQRQSCLRLRTRRTFVVVQPRCLIKSVLMLMNGE